ncbi:MAG: MarR family transcriptional regulator [Balneolaceae bacterium]|nr:MarR family transcriptional regulator [Balneolaceae bacterium]MBO6545370.1 MarR family transcriptional regulator [Balneolaceae bacterium]MBO6646766.1 MarR family transcriptional regulator [Balneolaceae bacterium]
MDTTTPESKQINEWEQLRINLHRTSNLVKNEIRAFLEQFDITPQQFSILNILREADGEPLSTNDICEKMVDKMSDTSRIVDRLISKDLAWKQPCSHDGRKVQVFLSNEGKYLLSTIDTKLKNLNSIFYSLSKDEASQLNGLLEKLRP